MSYVKRLCDYCSGDYLADTRNLKRGWGLCCSKSCAANKREKSKPNYDPSRVRYNNVKRAIWNYNETLSVEDYHDSIHPFSDEAFN